jgi:tetratricopeptide (TPR) repeat protein
MYGRNMQESKGSKRRKRFITIRPGAIVVLSFCLSLSSCKPNIKQLFVTAQRNFDQGEFKKAIGVYDQILQRDSLNQLAFFDRGRCNYFLGRDNDAIADYNKVISLQDTTDGQVEFRLNRDLPSTPEKERYKVSYEEALFLRAVTEYEIDSAKRAFRDFQNCLRIGYEKPACTRYLGCIYIAFNKKDKGCSLLKEAILMGDTTSYSLLHTLCY